MKAKISMITLGVEDLERATTFYRDGLGLPQHQFEGGGVSFFCFEWHLAGFISQAGTG
jgi:hypothetical protein